MFTLNCKGRLLVVDKPLVMGIINCTPDSFYAGSRSQGIDAVLQQAEQMLQEGATLLDLGGQSTRPGSTRIGPEEEAKRVVPAIAAVHQAFPGAILSVDTFSASVAAAAVEAGASIVNDISAGRMDEALIPTVAALQVPYVLMHMKGTPQTMQQEAVYEDVTREVLDFFIREMDRLQRSGIRDVIIDPGFGFGKTIAHNFTLLRRLEVFRMLQAPLLLGISRKSFIWKTLETTPEEALNGTTAMHMAGLAGGASILRVHDVKAAVETVKLHTALSGS